MTNPIKRFFEIIKAIVLFPISFLQMRRAYQELGKMRSLPEDPEEMRKFLKKMGLEDDMVPLLTPFSTLTDHTQPENIVDLDYLDDLDESELEDEEKVDESI
jgi:hypothetical protein